MVPLANKEDFFAPLQLVSTSSYCRACQWRSALSGVMNSLLEYIEPEGSSSTSCFGRTLLQMEEEGEIDNFEKCSLAMVWIIAAHASFPGFFASFVLSVSSRLDVQQCARQELASNIDAYRFSQSDRQNLPYCRAVVLEAIRCSGPAIDAPHLVTEDMVLGGYFIPACTALVLDTWTINHDDAMLFEVSEAIALHMAQDNFKSR